MEKIFCQTELDVRVAERPVERVTRSDWQHHLPVLSGTHVRLRQLRPSDAPSLFTMLTTEEVARFISPPPSTVDGFEQFITRSLAQQALGLHLCFAVTRPGDDTAVGLFQVRQLETGFATAEWGFAIGSPFWGSGIFAEGAALVLDFVFGTIGVRRLEARAAVQNGRGNGALLKVGAVQEGILRKSFERNGRLHDQVLYSILVEDWLTSRLHRQVIRRPSIH
jgi:ribosomal-protein-alanine N-acetyltransferase